MESKILKFLVVLGVPGVSLGAFYLLLKSFSFKFSEIPPIWSAATAIVFVLAVTIVTVFALHRWSPKVANHNTDKSPSSTWSNAPQDYSLKVGEVTVTFEEKMRSIDMDVIKVNARDHAVGVGAEYAWLNHNYPGYECKSQALTTLDLMTSDSNYASDQIHFDKLSIKLEDGRIKDVYFDISEFFSGEESSLLNPRAFASRKLSEIYRAGGST